MPRLDGRRREMPVRPDRQLIERRRLAPPTRPLHRDWRPDAVGATMARSIADGCDSLGVTRSAATLCEIAADPRRPLPSADRGPRRPTWVRRPATPSRAGRTRRRALRRPPTAADRASSTACALLVGQRPVGPTAGTATSRRSVSPREWRLLITIPSSRPSSSASAKLWLPPVSSNGLNRTSPIRWNERWLRDSRHCRPRRQLVDVVDDPRATVSRCGSRIVLEVAVVAAARQAEQPILEARRSAGSGRRGRSARKTRTTESTARPPVPG